MQRKPNDYTNNVPITFYVKRDGGKNDANDDSGFWSLPLFGSHPCVTSYDVDLDA